MSGTHCFLIEMMTSTQKAAGWEGMCRYMSKVTKHMIMKTIVCENYG
jgi:hypothetical protein